MVLRHLYKCRTKSGRRDEYACPCGRGMVVDETVHKKGRKHHYTYIDCPECETKYFIDFIVSRWIVKER